jgi:hypothetical protein
MTDVELFQHSEFKAHNAEWRLSRTLYEANREELRASDILWSHLFEEKTLDGQTTLRPLREKRSQYTNLKEPIVSAFTTLFFRNDPDTSGVDKIFGPAISNVDGENRSLVTFIKETLFANYFLYGRGFIVTDTPAVDVVTKEDEQRLGVRPRWLGLGALSVPDWSKGSSGYKLIRYEYDEDAPRGDLDTKPQMVRKSKSYKLGSGAVTVREYTQAGTTTWTPSVEAQVKISEIPVSVVSGRAWTKDIDPLLMRLFNLESTLDSQILHQAYQRVFIIGDVDSKALQQSGEFVISILPAGSSVHVVEPADTSPTEKRISATSSQIYRIAFNQSRTVSADSRAVEGEDSAAERKEELVSLIKSEIEQIEKCVNDAVRHWATLGGFDGYDPETHVVKFSRDITRDDVEKAMESLAFLRDYLPKYPKWEKATLKKVARSQGLPEYKEIEAEIESGPAAVSVSTAQGAAKRLQVALNGAE